MSKFFLGLDLGQAADYTALCILERQQATRHELVGHGHYSDTAVGLPYYHARHLQRFPLGTRYPTIVESVQRLVATPPLSTVQGDAYRLIVDATGVGAPVLDLLKAARLPVIAVLITSGSEASGDDWEGYHVPKRVLVSNLLVLLQAGRLKFAEGLPEAPALIKELQAFKVKVSLAGHDSYEAWRASDHDDIVLSLAMAAWYAEQQSGFQTIVIKHR